MESLEMIIQRMQLDPAVAASILSAKSAGDKRERSPDQAQMPDGADADSPVLPRRELVRAMEKACIPLRHAELIMECTTQAQFAEPDFSLGCLDDRYCLAFTKNWLMTQASKHPLLTLCGNTGCGKSVAAAWAITHVIKNTPVVRGLRWINSYDLATLFGSYRMEEEKKAIENSSILVIDEFRRPEEITGRSNSFFDPALLFLLDKRCNQKRKTIITTNLKPKEIKTCLSKETFRRFTDFGIACQDFKTAPEHKTIPQGPRPSSLLPPSYTPPIERGSKGRW